MSFRTTRQADEDIIGLYVLGAAQCGVGQAERYHAGLAALFGLLADNPHIARLRTDFTPAVRLHPYHAHMVVCAEDEGGILVIRVLHGRQDWKRALGGME